MQYKFIVKCTQNIVGYLNMQYVEDQESSLKIYLFLFRAYPFLNNLSCKIKINAVQKKYLRSYQLKCVQLSEKLKKQTLFQTFIQYINENTFVAIYQFFILYINLFNCFENEKKEQQNIFLVVQYYFQFGRITEELFPPQFKQKY
ncbi:hypothetical protein ABPG74_009486 [Tetrahymena malaccensis]